MRLFGGSVKSELASFVLICECVVVKNTVVTRVVEFPYLESYTGCSSFPQHCFGTISAHVDTVKKTINYYFYNYYYY